MWGCDCAQEARESQPRPCGQRRGENSSERGVAKSRNNCRDKRKRAQPGSAAPIPGAQSAVQGPLASKAAQREPGEKARLRERARN